MLRKWTKKFEIEIPLQFGIPTFHRMKNRALTTQTEEGRILRNERYALVLSDSTMFTCVFASIFSRPNKFFPTNVFAAQRINFGRQMGENFQLHYSM